MDQGNKPQENEGRKPRVRDAVLNWARANPGRWATREEIAHAVGEDQGSVGCALYVLTKRSALVRRRRQVGTGRPFEYDVGPRVEAALRHLGKKFPLRGGHRRISGRETVGRSNAHVPAAVGGVGIVIKIDEVAHAITLADARSVYESLKALFERR